MREPISDLLPLDRLVPYLAEHVPQAGIVQSAAKTASGQSNPTFILNTDTGKLVLRRKPPGTLLKSAHAVEREFRVMKALSTTDFPVPDVFHLCEDEDIIGKAFFVMSFVEGVTFNDPTCPDLAPDTRRAVYCNMNKVLAQLHSLDVAALGLSDFGRPGSYFERQFSRWSKQYELTETENIPEMVELMDWLSHNQPVDDGKVALVHGDWRLDNLLVDPVTGVVNAVVDWELSTLGHPLADLGGQLMQWAMPPGEIGRGMEGVDRAALGLPEDRAYLELYAKNAGLDDVPDMRFCVAFSFFRMAAILQGVKKRALDGNASGGPQALKFGAYVPIFAKKALERLNAEA